MNLELRSLKLFAGATVAIAINAGCDTTVRTIGDNPFGKGGNDNAATGGAGGAALTTMPSGGSFGIGGTLATGGVASTSGIVSTAGSSSLGGAGGSGGTSNSTSTIDCRAMDCAMVPGSCGTVCTDLCLCCGGCSIAVGGAAGFGGSASGGNTAVGSLVTCSSNGQTYAVGDIVGGCLCLPDGTVGHCTGALLDCIYDGKVYAVGESFTAACGSCLCVSNGVFGNTWGTCTGTCVAP